MTIRIPDPKANTTTEAYLAYKAGYLEESELKPVLYEPYLHFDAWLAYWAGLTNTYPNNGVPIGKNLFNKKEGIHGALLDNGKIETIGYPYAGVSGFIKVVPGETYVVSGRNQWHVIGLYDADKKWIRRLAIDLVTIPDDCYWIRVGFQWPQDLDTVQVEEGDTATTYEVFKGEPEMLCDEEALVAYLSGVTETYPEEIKDPYDPRIVGYLRHIASIRFDAPDYPVNNEEFYLSTMGSSTIDSGDPSGEIELNGTAEAPFASVEVYGNTSQTTYTGKNLFNKDGAYIIGNGNPIVTPMATGVKMEYNTSGSYPFAMWIIGKTEDFVGKTITASANVVKSASGLIPTIGIGLCSSDGGLRLTKAYITGDGEKKTTWTVAEDEERDSVFVSFYVTNNGEYSQGDYTEYNNAQVEIGSDPSSYEPFVGGDASPSPSYPQPIEVATGVQYVSTSGKNLFNPEIEHQYPGETSLVIDVDEEAGSLTMEAIGDVGSQLCYVEVEVPDATKTYTLSGLASKLSHGDASGDRYQNLWVRYLVSEDGSSWDTNYYALWEKSNPVDGKVEEISGSVTGYKFYRFLFYNYSANPAPIGAKTVYYNLQLEEGDTATPFSKYKAPATYKINLGQNLFNINATPNYRYATSSVSGQSITCTSDSAAQTSRVDFAIDYPTGKSLTLSYDYEVLQNTSQNTSMNVYLRNSSGSTSTILNTNFSLVQGATGHKTVTLPGGTSLSNYRLWFYLKSGANEGVVSVKFTNVQLEVSDEETAYEQYIEPIKLCKIGEYQDYIYQDADNDWYLHKEIGRYVFNGDEDWQASQYGVNSWELPNVLDFPFDTNKLQILSIVFRGIPHSQRGSSGNNTVYVAGPRLFVVRNTELDSVEKIKTATSGTELYYALGTSTDTKITDATLVSQLSALKEGGSYEGKTFITMSANTPNLNALLKVEVYKY